MRGIIHKYLEKVTATSWVVNDAALIGLLRGSPVLQ